jgi:adenylate kinase
MVSAPATRPHFLIFGPPGSGKSTQAAFLMRDWPLVAISTGQLLRGEGAAGTALGEQVRPILARGDLVPDPLMVAIIRAWLAALPPNQGFLLDGFPRTITQAQALDTLLAEQRRPLTAIITLDLPLADAVARLGGRRICHGVDPEEILHIDDADAVERCLARGGLLVQRPDDLPQAIQRRMAVYEAATAPLLAFYQPQGIVHRIAATGSPEEVADRISWALGAPPTG